MELKKDTGPLCQATHETGHACPGCEKCASPMPVQAQPEVPEELRRMGELIRTQDNECTAHAMFVVEQERVVTGIDPDFDPEIVWLIEDQMIFKGDEGFEALEAAYEADGTVPQDYTRTGYTKHWDFVTAFLTREAAADFVDKHGHKYSGPLRFTVECEHRNMEWRFVREWLMSLAAAAPVEAQPVASDEIWHAAACLHRSIVNYEGPAGPVPINPQSAMVRELGRALAATQPASAPAELAAMEARKDAAYLERNQVVAALAKCFPSGVTRTAIEGWSDDWHGCVYIDLPTGQASWHFHDSHSYLFDGLLPYAGTWDGHTTGEKYARVAALPAGLPNTPDADKLRRLREGLDRFGWCAEFGALAAELLRDVRLEGGAAVAEKGN